MKKRFYLSEKALSNLAIEVRRASWGFGAVAGFFGFSENEWMFWALGLFGWLAAQVVAFGLESVNVSKGEFK